MRYLKLDLHTHPFEAMGFPDPSIDTVARIVRRVKESGLDGIAVTEHETPFYGFKAAEIAEEYFPEVIVIPGVELNVEGLSPVTHRQIVELYLGERVFRFQAHPYEECPDILALCQGIEVKNYLHKEMNSKLAEEAAAKLNLVPLRNSDAHRLEDLGKHYNIISVELLVDRSERRKNSNHPWMQY
ncbi:MAG: PHP domain-containing protein [Candidatus Nezhaarchaeota archaeon]|nr:PHP domain-containing protein [Candidatus Nezhaarchaeota archaeon]